MAIHIEQLEIEAFRGIQQLSVPHLNHINIIAGDNNCGKTSFLEALMLLRNVEDLNNIIRVVQARENFPALVRPPFFDRFLSLFPAASEPSDTRMIGLRASCDGETISLRLKGHLSDVMLEELPRQNYGLSGAKRSAGPLEVQAFSGDFTGQRGEYRHQEPVMIHEYIAKSAIIKERTNIVYLPPFDHLRGSTFSRILRNDSYKELCLHILHLFDPGIRDLLLLRNETLGGRAAEYVKHRDLGVMPLTSYGDGIKKVLSLASGVAQAVNGVLLIDEVETAIHSRYFEEIFRFIVSACVRFDVQLFVTSHSMEAIDGFLATQDYDKKSGKEEDILSIITLKKEGGASFSRVLNGEQVYRNREAFGFEVRL